MSLKHSCPSWGMSIPYDCTLKGMNVYDKYLTYDFVKHLFSMNSSNCVYAKRTECTNRTETCIYENVQCDLFKKWENIQGSAEGNMWEGSYKLWWKTDTPPPPSSGCPAVTRSCGFLTSFRCDSTAWLLMPCLSSLPSETFIWLPSSHKATSFSCESLSVQAQHHRRFSKNRRKLSRAPTLLEGGLSEIMPQHSSGKLPKRLGSPRATSLLSIWV